MWEFIKKGGYSLRVERGRMIKVRWVISGVGLRNWDFVLLKDLK